MEIMDGTLTELLSLNASWSEILVKGNIPCNRRQTKSEDKIRSQARYEQKYKKKLDLSGGGGGPLLFICFGTFSLHSLFK